MLNYHQTVKEQISKYNKNNPLVDYLMPLIEDKKEVKIADLGSGAFSTIGSYFPNVHLDIYHSDKQNFTSFYKKNKITPIITIEYQDMEELTYIDNFFDIVHCVNALDHTFDAYEAIKEMVRVCKQGGWIYIKCNLNQLNTGGKHFWNAKKDGVFTNGVETFDLKNFGFRIEFIDNGGESRYDQIIATLKK